MMRNGRKFLRKSLLSPLNSFPVTLDQPCITLDSKSDSVVSQGWGLIPCEIYKTADSKTPDSNYKMIPKGFDVFEEREITPIENSAISYFFSPYHLYIYRITCIYISILMIGLTLFYDPASWPRFLSNWSWLGLFYYFMISTFLSRSYLKDAVGDSTWWCWSQSGVMNHAYIALFATSMTMPWVATVIYISKFTPTTFSPDFIVCDVLQHSLNIVIVTIDLFICKAPLPAFSCIYPIIFGWLYVFWTWILVYSGYWDWPYSFFDFVFNPRDRPMWLTLPALLCAVVGVMLTFGICFLLVEIREYLGNRDQKTCIRKGFNSSSSLFDDDITLQGASFKDDILLN